MANLLDLIEKGSGQALAELTEKAPEIRAVLGIAERNLPVVFKDERTLERILLDDLIDLLTQEV